jgi:putative DNA primase/helicase
MSTDPNASQMYMLAPIETSEEDRQAFNLPEELTVNSFAGDSTYMIINKENDSGVFYLEPQKNGDLKYRFLCSILLVIALYRNVSNTGWGRLLTFKDLDDHEHEFVLNAGSVSKDESTLISLLRNTGLTVTGQRFYHPRLIDYLLNTPPVSDRRIRSTNKTGWYKKNFFITPLQSFGSTNEEIIYDGKCNQHSCAVNGTLEQWKENIARYCVGNPLLTFSVSMAFAAPLLNLLEIENGGFNLMGESSIGKSTALKVATSVFGRPEKGHAIQQWNATVNAMEGIANSYNDMLLPLDEIGQATGNEVGNTIYMLGNGMGKGRMMSNAELRDRQTFRTIFLSSGEKTLEAHMGESGKSVRAGQEVRLVDILADMGLKYGIYNHIHGFDNSHDFNEFMLGNLTQYYGTPMVAYLEKLVQLPESAIEQLRDVIDRFISESVPADAGGQVKRIAGRFALLACAGELATKFEITGWVPKSVYHDVQIMFNRWLNERGNTGQSEEQKLIDQVRRFFELHGESRFANLCGGDTRSINNRVGFREVAVTRYQDRERSVEVNESHHVYYVMSEGFKEITAGFSQKQAIRTLLAHGILKPNNETAAMHSKRLPGLAGPKKVYIFTSSIIEDFEESDESGSPLASEGTEGTQVQPV